MSKQLKDLDEVLFRQIRSKHLMDQGSPSSEAFRPMPKDDNRLSLDRSSKTTPEWSFGNFRDKGYDSVAVFGVSVAEFNTLEILCFDDPRNDNDSYAYADFSTLHSKSHHIRVSKRLKQKAIERGQLFPYLQD